MLKSFWHQVRRQFAAVQQSIRISGLKELAMNTFSRNLSLSLALLGGAAMAPQVLADDGYALAFEPSAARSSVQMETLHANILEVAKDYCPTYQEARSFRVVNACVREVAGDLVSKVGQPEFTAYVERLSGAANARLIAANN